MCFLYLLTVDAEVGNAYHGPRFDPADLLDDEGGVKCVVVAVSYRLNLFGFLASKELRDESGDGSVGNYGFHDQRAGLEWTHQHIAAFGGNPDNITLGGLSAGKARYHFNMIRLSLTSASDRRLLSPLPARVRVQLSRPPDHQARRDAQQRDRGPAKNGRRVAAPI